MIFRPFYYYDLGCAAYLFGCGSLGRCAVVDARADDVEKYLAFAAQKGMQITHVIDTHVHADHRSGGPELARRAEAVYAAHESADLAIPLFVGAVGRPDLPGRARENAAALHASLYEQLLTLPDDVEIYPGHFSGSVCGTGLSGKPASTIGFERRWNPMLSMEKQAFVDALADVPEKPVDMTRILAFNRGVDETRVGA